MNRLLIFAASFLGGAALMGGAIWGVDRLFRRAWA